MIQSNKLTDVNSTKYSNLLRYIVGYGLPLLIMTVYLLVSNMKQQNSEKTETEGFKTYEKTNYCWLNEDDLKYFFVGPVAITLIINSFVFFLAISVANKTRKNLNNSKPMKIFNQIKTWAILTFLLGQTWLTGFLIQKHILGFTYIFVALNGSSGIFLFIHTILMNDVIMLELKIKFGFADQVELALNNSGSRITASKSFKVEERPKIKKRKPRQKTASTSSDELPQLPRPTRKPYTKHQSRHVSIDTEVFEKNKPKYVFSDENLWRIRP